MRQTVGGWKGSPGRHRSGFRWEVVRGKDLVEGLSEDRGGGSCGEDACGGCTLENE